MSEKARTSRSEGFAETVAETDSDLEEDFAWGSFEKALAIEIQFSRELFSAKCPESRKGRRKTQKVHYTLEYLICIYISFTGLLTRFGTSV
jgi:hypothetical protein